MKGSSKIHFHNKNNSLQKHKTRNQAQTTPIKMEGRPISALSVFKQRNQFRGNSLQKQNKGNSNNIFKANPIPNKAKEPLRLRTYTNQANSKTTNIQQHERHREQKKEVHREQSIQCSINQIISLLKKNFILTQSHITTYTINKDHIFRLIKFIIQKDINEPSEFPFLDKIIAQVNSIIQQQKLRVKAHKNKMVHKLIQFQFSKEKYFKEVKVQQNQIQVLIKKQKQITNSINHIFSIKPQLEQEYLKTQKALNDNRKNIEQSTTTLANLKRKQQQLKQQLQKYSAQVERVKKEVHSIQGFINTQNNQLIIMASEEYKNIETDIYDYASYLQCNQLASSLVYQPLSITCITENLQEEIKNINKTLIQNEQMDAKEKGRAMRDFLIEWMNKFKKKEEQMREMMGFKTKCVRNFIEKMQKWMENWTFKQEYLVSLKKQFVVNSSHMNELLKSLASPHFCELCHSILQPLHSKLSETYQKIETNYKLGNSFY